MMQEALESTYSILGRDFANAGRVSTQIKDTLKRLGVHPAVVRRVAIVSYEAEMNLVMYATRGKIQKECG
ncbi:MAG: putative anti-sigma regulatory factor, serine/threonine protein kinase [Acidobacteria bacterium]|nr:putative anti-sigma regulatory factor, serine/threonine protein kinase [Acidobacteriota bacterium]